MPQALKYVPLSRSPYSRSYYSGNLSLTQVLSKATLPCPCSWELILLTGDARAAVLPWCFAERTPCPLLLLARPPAHCCSSQCSYQASQCFYRVAPDQRHQNHFVAQFILFKPIPQFLTPLYSWGWQDCLPSTDACWPVVSVLVFGSPDV